MLWQEELKRLEIQTVNYNHQCFIEINFSFWSLEELQQKINYSLN